MSNNCIDKNMSIHLRAIGRHLPYETTRSYLLPDTSERAPSITPAIQAGTVVLDFCTPEGWKAELT